jgi:hypothetical protein
VIWGRGGGRTQAKNRRPSGFPNNKAKTALKLPWLRNAQLLRSQTELFLLLLLIIIINQNLYTW